MLSKAKNRVLIYWALGILIITGFSLYKIHSSWTHKTISENSYSTLPELVNALNDYKLNLLGTGDITLEEYFDYPYQYIDCIDFEAYTVLICSNSEIDLNLETVNLRFLFAQKDNKKWKIIESTRNGENSGSLKLNKQNDDITKIKSDIDTKIVCFSSSPFKDQKYYEKWLQFENKKYLLYYAVEA